MCAGGYSSNKLKEKSWRKGGKSTSYNILVVDYLVIWGCLLRGGRVSSMIFLRNEDKAVLHGVTVQAGPPETDRLKTQKGREERRGTGKGSILPVLCGNSNSSPMGKLTCPEMSLFWSRTKLGNVQKRPETGLAQHVGAGSPSRQL